MLLVVLSSPRVQLDEYFVIGLWFFVGIANNIFWGLRAMNDLKAKFRQLAARAAGA